MKKRNPLKREVGLPTHAGIYKIVNDITGQTYVGQTTCLRGHAGHHACLLAAGLDYNPHLQNSYNKYGGENFTFVALEMVADVQARTRREQLHMDNIGPLGHPLLFNTKPAGPSGSLGVRQPMNQRLKHSRSKGGRPFFATNEITGEVYRFEQIGELMKTFPNFRRAHVSACLNGRRYSHAGFVFDFDPAVQAIAAKNTTGGPVGPNQHSRAIVATEISTGKRLRFAYATEIKRSTDFSLSAVYECLKGARTSYRDFTFEYENGQPHKAVERVRNKGPRKHGGSRAVIGMNPHTGETVRFAYIRLAAETLGVAPQNISTSIKKRKSGRTWTAGGFAWRYEDQNEIL